MSPYRSDSRMSGRHPFEIYILFLAVVTGLPTVLGIAPRPGSVATALPGWAAIGWSWVLVVGALAALLGIYVKDRGKGLILEQLGLGFAGVASLIYCGCVLAVIGGAGAITAGIVGGFGISCLIRYRDIQRDLDYAQAEAKGMRMRRGKS